MHRHDDMLRRRADSVMRISAFHAVRTLHAISAPRLIVYVSRLPESPRHQVRFTRCRCSLSSYDMLVSRTQIGLSRAVILFPATVNKSPPRFYFAGIIRLIFIAMPPCLTLSGVFTLLLSKREYQQSQDDAANSASNWLRYVIDDGRMKAHAALSPMRLYMLDMAGALPSAMRAAASAPNLDRRLFARAHMSGPFMTRRASASVRFHGAVVRA